MPESSRSNSVSPPAVLLLVGLAGWVDVIGFVTAHGYFVSFMSGNSTQLSIAAGHGDWQAVLAFAGLVGSFVVGIATGEAIGQGQSGSRRGAVFVLETAGMWLAVWTQWRGYDAAAVLGPLAFCMGMHNATLPRTGAYSDRTYVTGTLVQLGRAIGTAISGASAWREVGPPAATWLAFAAAGLSSAVISVQFGTTAALVIAAVTLTLFSAWYLRAAGRKR